jgi:MarR family transcriptional regulator for hemolysin
MEQAGLVRRQRGGPDRRAVQVEVTPAGRVLHGRLLKTVIGFNRQLRTGFSAEDEETLRSLLDRLQQNVG